MNFLIFAHNTAMNNSISMQKEEVKQNLNIFTGKDTKTTTDIHQEGIGEMYVTTEKPADDIKLEAVSPSALQLSSSQQVSSQGCSRVFIIKGIHSNLSTVLI